MTVGNSITAEGGARPRPPRRRPGRRDRAVTAEVCRADPGESGQEIRNYSSTLMRAGIDCRGSDVVTGA